ncbi:MAG: 16S rRNA (cytosine(1402)-N(4))-methyltransferase [Candidatus Moranbacteria bacterium RIFOXYA12_FULL_35_19]|nr:MAG: Ribosomal RNA small subunit methyltransferase H [Candidatus Moranbacteria bacterium GW2011_GWF2_35_39]OGI32089.1 MAG: 16S rRNA (cytosine(1402)-N(4))-methyltransferase [Candidatus Moranbacteria bacterium RIFOXYC12_FULL_36_13]OGI32452.1 MAG: 16S rRNA (cytosine(1402)-N(4))-methyltransferase [Candidatus Moranbacteria bacterium RIFOXYB12_FULL_35_8]OGI36749.1 MAG: 16S rRNA (cytosine(1402)-N(4))-methyltransferase [Candidatus Moranbacteria bacterium RIFOXYA12_FULL_35_19]
MSVHKPVLLKEIIELLNIKPSMIVVDATFGGGGHAREILKKIGKKGILIGIDADIKAIENFAEFPISNFQSTSSADRFPNNFQIPIYKKENIFLVNSNFNNLETILEAIGIEKVDAILADLGWSSDQLIGKGMSFQEDEEIDMRLSLRITNQYECTNNNKNAKDIVNEYSEEELGKIIREYGEEKFWKNIARKIIAYRKDKKIETTKELAEIISSAIPERFKNFKLNPATRTFQALRIEVNKELENLEKFISQAIDRLNSGGRLAIISFHSLEDRIVKDSFRENARGCICPPDFPKCVCGKKPKVVIITRKPIVPTDLEVSDNPRSRSAKLRVCEVLRTTSLASTKRLRESRRAK